MCSRVTCKIKIDQCRPLLSRDSKSSFRGFVGRPLMTVSIQSRFGQTTVVSSWGGRARHGRIRVEWTARVLMSIRRLRGVDLLETHLPSGRYRAGEGCCILSIGLLTGNGTNRRCRVGSAVSTGYHTATSLPSSTTSAGMSTWCNGSRSRVDMST